jgi:hypothetical protein
MRLETRVKNPLLMFFILHTQPTQAQGVILHVFHYHVVSDNGTQKRLIYYTLLHVLVSQACIIITIIYSS